MVELRPLSTEDVPGVCQWWLEHWGGDTMVVHGEVFRPDSLDGFVALEEDRWVGLVTFRIHQGECEILSLDSLQEQRGTGTRLMQSVIEEARGAGCRRVRLTTTNDNLNALKFYQKRGFALVAIRRNAMDETRRHKPDIPLIGENGIPLRDEIEIEFLL
jgi:ribosomal protein S18 acetylase RimI-like enzyme